MRLASCTKITCWALAFFVLCQQAFAANLIAVYHEALDNDPDFKIAYSQFMSQAEALPQAWSSLLPQLTLTALAGRNDQIVHSTSFNVRQSYNGNVWKVNASQALFNYKSWALVQQARASVRSALANFNNAAQQLMLRTSNAYFQVLLAEDTLDYALSKQRANLRQLTQAKQRFQVGLDAITAVYEAQAAYDQSCAQVIAAKNEVSNQNQALRKLTNHLYDHLAGLRQRKIPLIQPQPNNVNDWIQTGLKQNYSLCAAKFNLEVARENIKAQGGGNWPVFSLQGNSSETHYNLNTQQTGTINSFASGVFIPQKQALSSVSLNMNFPMFQGGLVVSQTRQASYDFQTSSQQLVKVYRGIMADGHIDFNNVTAGIEQVKADRKTVFSQQASLTSVEAQYLAGTRTMTDVLLAERNLFESKQQLAKDQYTLINAILTLKYLAGTLNVDDLEQINGWLLTASSSTPRK